jgi:aromatic ring-opening dioxygenase catalytic subunit (LigB family)
MGHSVEQGRAKAASAYEAFALEGFVLVVGGAMSDDTTKNSAQMNRQQADKRGGGGKRITRREVLGGAVATAVMAVGAVAAAPSDEAKRGAKKVNTRTPVIYLPHGGGPCFFMKWTMGPPNTWDRMAGWLRGLPGALPSRPKALLVVSAHWEERVPTVLAAQKPPLLYDYSGFPKHTYELQWPAPGSPKLAARVQALLTGAGIANQANTTRGFDHGVFVPLKLSFPNAEVPTIQLSLQAGLDPATHLKIGKALEPLRDEGVLIIGSGLSYHNMRGFGRARSEAESKSFDHWLNRVVTGPAAERDASLIAWAKAPSARQCHPREEHLLPLMVVAGAAGADTCASPFRDHVMGVHVSGHVFG